MSVNREDFGVEFEIKVGTTKQFEFELLDPDDGTVVVLTDTDFFSTGSVKIIKPGGTIITTVSIIYEDRANGIVSFVLNFTSNDDAGNWIGELNLVNVNSKTIDQRFFNMIIRQSF